LAGELSKTPTAVGETCGTYENPSTKGIGESIASQTAWAIMGICACGDLDRPSIQRGLRYLLSSQKLDGCGMKSRLQAGFSGVFYLKYDMHANFPLLAPATYVNAAVASHVARVFIANKSCSHDSGLHALKVGSARGRWLRAISQNENKPRRAA
jgi:hypothetical protein